MKEIIDKTDSIQADMQYMFSVFTRTLDKASEIFHYPMAWISGFGLFILNAVSDGRLIIYIVVIASVIDLICGIAVSVSRKQFTHSELMRQTVEKLVIYGLALLVFLCVDKLIEQETTITLDITSGLVGIIIALTETWSFMASLLILFPGNVFLHAFQKVLTGELARKLGCTEEEVKEIMSQAAKRKAIKRDSKGRFAKK